MSNLNSCAALLQRLASPASAGVPAAASPDSFVHVGVTGTLEGGLSKYRVFLTGKMAGIGLCRHMVGRVGSKKVCCAPVVPGLESCGTAHHGDRLLLEPLAIYLILQRSPTLQINRETSLDANLLTEGFLTTISSASKTLDEWTDVFTLVQLLGSSPDGPKISESDILALRESLAVPLRTPRRPVGRSRPMVVNLDEASATGGEGEIGN
jgi:hypothetical protein